MKAKNRLIQKCMAAALGLGVGVLVGSIATARAAGRLQILDAEVPPGLKGAKLRKFLRKHKVKQVRLTPDKPDAKLWARLYLQRAPRASWLQAPHNGGKVRIELYRRAGKRWKLENTQEVAYPVGKRVATLPFEIKSSWGIPLGVRYRVRVTVLDGRKRPRVLARAWLRVRK